MEAHILVAEDEERLRTIIRDYFTAHGLTCALAKDGEEALERLRERDYDAVLLDVLMPNLDGFAVCRAVREGSGVPILFLTALGGEKDVLRGYALGADDYVTKPFSPAELTARIDALYRRITWHRRGKVKVVWRCGAHQDKAASCPDSPTIEEAALQRAVMEAISQQYIHKGEAMEITMQSIRSVLTPETADSEYVIRTKINELQKERRTLIAKALAENDDGKYDFQFLRIKNELEQLQAQLEGVQAAQKSQTADKARMAEIAALLEQFRESGLSFDNVLVRKVVETVRVESAEKLEITFKDGNRRVVPISEGR